MFYVDIDEIEELSGRLKASRQRVADLEKSLATTNSSSQQFEKVFIVPCDVS